MAEEVQKKEAWETEKADSNMKLDDDGRSKRTGNLWSATAHIITAVIGSGVLSLAWAMAQLGWIGGVVALVIFSLITLYASLLLSESYRTPDDSMHGKRNYTYMQAVKNNLGGAKYMFCGVAQYANFLGASIGYIITASISMAAINRSNCFHKHGHNVGCHTRNNNYIAVFGAVQVILSQIPNIEKLTGLSTLAAIMSFAYSGIGIGLSIARLAGGGHAVKTSFTGLTVGVEVATKATKIWNMLQAIGNIAFAYQYSQLIIEIQDTLKSNPSETRVMKWATTISVITTTAFYMMCGVLGYAAFGNDAPGNFLTGFGFFEPYWLVDFANACIVVHLFGAYQVFSQPLFKTVEKRLKKKWPNCGLWTIEWSCCGFKLNLFRIIWRTVYVACTTVVAMIFPFFNSIMGLIGAISFWPLTVFFPVEMHIAMAKVPKNSGKWIWLQSLSGFCFLVSAVAAAGSIEGLVTNVRAFKLFTSES